jgi:transposase
MRFVATKSEDQQSGLMLHRSRQLLVRQRTMLSNAIRGHMAELGIIAAEGRRPSGRAHGYLLEKIEKLCFFVSQHLANHIALTIRDVAIREKLLVKGNIFLADKCIEGHHNASPIV